MKVKSVVSALIVLGAILSSQAASPYENERQEVKRLLREDFEALNRGDKTLVEVGEHALALTESSMSVMRRRILLDGTVRLFTAAGETNRASKVRLRMETAADTFAAYGRDAVLHLGKYGEIEFAECPTGTVDVAVHWRNGKTVRVTLTKPYWIMKYPLTQLQSALFPPLDPPNKTTRANYVYLNRSQTEELCGHFTRHFRNTLPKGYVVRLPTLAEWEHAFHAGTTDRASPFYDLLHIHVNDEVDRAVRYDYDRNEPRRKKAVNDWGIGDWCGQEKVYDTVDPSKITKSAKDGGDFHQVQGLPPFETTVDPCFTYAGTNAMSLVRMPFWARWYASRIGYKRDATPIRLVIGPEIK